jgi:F-type H+-transporting ATPase subunit a
MAVEGGLTASEYIVHHLTFWQNHPLDGVVDFSVFNVDAVLWSVVLGVLMCYFLWRAARAASAGVPGRFQAAVEILVEFVDNQTKAIVHNAKSREFAAPMALVLFIWILLMNTMDLLPVDLLPSIWGWIYGAAGGNPHHAYMRVVPTADVSTCMGLSVTVLLLSLYYNLKIKGVGGWIHELFTAPFGKHPVLWPINFAMQIIEFISKTVSHGLRLFGNMYAGELMFLLIALLGGAAAASLPGVLLPIGQIITGTLWAIFHILIITIQAFIFMMLALVYVGQAHDYH